MKVKIAIIGPKDFCTRIKKLVINRHDIELIPYQYDEPKETALLINTLKPCDAILFSGSLPHLFAKNELKSVTIPVLYMKQDETAVAITLLHLATQKQLDLNRISIDIRDVKHINNVINDLNQTTSLPFIHLLKDLEEIDKITSFHKNLSVLGKTDMAITSVHAVYKQLKQNKIPAIRMIDPESSLLQTIEQVKQQAILHKSDAAQIAVGIVKNANPDHNLNPFVDQISSIMQAQWSKQQTKYTIYTTMGNVEFALKSQAFLTLFQTVDQDTKIAFGCGETIVDATENAHLALEFIQKNDNQSFYLLDSHKKMHGPFPQSSSTIDMKLNEPELVEMAAKTKLSPANISKLIMFSQSRQSKQFTAHDLSLYLGVTRRTAERTLKTLVEFNYAIIVGEEMTYRQGRPRTLYEFDFALYF
ncbi:hypothetical protein [Sporosarcina sp. G11-34]|uniref:hypothetical protein n=1 Tax=Sporosarcina sp. G11-34 TaxID=2849605 RepID=UPI0022A9D889|nr:hypothetical protein [Sporosarcina sp. G11-34]MCZ2260858.1 hypothetical protein [Sporosarcina sp. G11-34]